MELNNEINLNNNLTNEKEQKNFLETTLGKTINTAVDIGIRAILPDFVEEQIINLKDNLLDYGLKDGIKKTIDDAINFGKSAIGIVTGNFESVEQVQMVAGSGGILDGISSLFDMALDKSVDSGKITKSARQKIKSSKNSILKNIKSEVTEELDNQIKYVEKIEEYSGKWKECYENQDLKGMKNANKNIQKYLEKTLPLENVLKEARKIEIMQNLVENTGSFEITEEERELAEALAS